MEASISPSVGGLGQKARSGREGVYVIPIRILVVDDFESWRHFIVSALRKLPTVCRIYEASDGLEAVQKTERLKPDLIVLDLGLPIMNGMVAARQIHSRAPRSKILFLSQESDPDVIHEAMKFGAGFLTKTDAYRELLIAVGDVMRGEKFISSGLSYPNSDEALDEWAPR
jgi:DNA-binding NarL/FixJ family response regulator